MKVLGEYVLVQQTDTKKESSILLPGKSERTDGYTTTFKIEQIGAAVPENYGIKVGDVPVFSNHVQFNGMNVTSPIKEKKVMTALTMIHYLDIIAVE